MSTALERIRIVLVEPAGPLNVGSVARIMKNMGLRQLVLVNPHCDPLGPEARQMAVHAADILETAQLVETLPLALTNCYRAIATTARVRSHAIPLEHPRQALPWLLETPSALIFGPEDRGLNNAELNLAQRSVGIPSHPDYPSLNLAQAVAVCCYELYQTVQMGSMLPAVNGVEVPEVPLNMLAPIDALEQYLNHLETVLLNIGFLYPQTAPSRMQKFRQMAQRTHLSPEELTMLRGILSQIEWAIRQGDRFL
ncbi:MAG: RNA methyltransferase [Thermosynechococcaceae cyanobacterium]